MNIKEKKNQILIIDKSVILQTTFHACFSKLCLNRKYGKEYFF